MSIIDHDHLAWLELLAIGEIEILGRMPWSSNGTYLVALELGDLQGQAIYKPGSGERPLRDFPGGLYRREAAAYELSLYTELAVVPETIVRTNGPLGVGSFQRYIEANFEEHYFTLFERGGFEESLRSIAGFDLLANNADRKGGHLLVDIDDRIWGIDNGLCFHRDDKLRTVMWDFAGELLPDSIRRACEMVTTGVSDAIANLLEEEEIAALSRRAEFYLHYGRFPHPGEGHRAYPWPLV